ncbi:protein kinase subdomain-containing protein [Trichophyton tonsurans CBS 112818]|uniref:Protein kinase subdomain-containing protein n=1 Tax=Trichophyton tonsurans (strain CBS 112818) TaxID=647933 RepID=F2S2H7_TRIT1|nr:protein kinase subdomain-containing protein [Trichophyton tonsurans CBS 112818]
MLSVDNTAILREFAKAEAENLSPRKKIDESRIVYKSRRFGSKGVLCDFGEARIGKGHESRPFIQPHIYRSPKTSLKESIYGVFGDIFDAKGGHNASKHLAFMVGIVGPTIERACQAYHTPGLPRGPIKAVIWARERIVYAAYEINNYSSGCQRNATWQNSCLRIHRLIHPNEKKAYD